MHVPATLPVRCLPNAVPELHLVQSYSQKASFKLHDFHSTGIHMHMPDHFPVAELQHLHSCPAFRYRSKALAERITPIYPVLLSRWMLMRGEQAHM